MLELFAALPFPEIDPALVTIPKFNVFGMELGPFPLRWYALSYIAGLVICLFYGYRLVARPRLYGGVTPLTRDDLDEFFLWCILGVILGGRIGYILFYDLPFGGGTVAQNPLAALRVWEGGLSFHGGLIGVSLAMILVARARKISLFSLTDTVATVVPITIFMVRIANFINAELYGRPTDGPFGMIFPEGYSPNNAGPPVSFDALNREWIYRGDEMARHPSQLYEAATEGLLLGAILAILVWRFRLLRKPGLITGVFLVGYSLSRTFVENFREPDAHISFLFGDVITMGMVLSFPMLVGGSWLIWQGIQRPPLTGGDTKTATS